MDDCSHFAMDKQPHRAAGKGVWLVAAALTLNVALKFLVT
jgi:hypothetical protein